MMSAETTILIRKALDANLIDHKLPRHLMTDLVYQISDNLGDRYHTGADKEAELLGILYDHPLMASIGATKWDVVVWFTTGKLKNNL